MKKWILVVPFILATTCLAQALDLGAIDAALERANTQAKVTYEKSTVPPTHFESAEKRAAFNYYLIKAVYLLNRSGNLEGCSEEICGYSREEFLLMALRSAIESRFEDEVPSSRYLTNDEKRAARYALFTLMINGDEKEKFAAYRPYLGYTQEWMNEHPIENWPHYVQACEKAMNYFYDLMKEVVEADRAGELEQILNYNTWMMMSH